MPLTVVVGSQFGGEGKGKIVSHLAKVDNVDFVVRCGGPNSGHTVNYNGSRLGLRMVPAGFVNRRTKLLIAPGALVNIRILFEEMRICGVDSSRLVIDRNACIVTEDYSRDEHERGLQVRIGSTASGTGVAVAKRALRDPDVRLASNVECLEPFIGDVSMILNEALDNGQKVVIEGTQGFGLSLYHTLCYPYSTSRDTTAMAFLSEVGLAASLVTEVIMAVRTFPIRVEGESGPLTRETSWQRVQEISDYPYPICEKTTATQRARRVAEFDVDLVRSAARANRPTQLALHGVDYLTYNDKGINKYDNLSAITKKFVRTLEESLRLPITFIGTGPKDEELIDRRKIGSEWPIKTIERALSA